MTAILLGAAIGALLGQMIQAGIEDFIEWRREERGK